MAEQQIGNLSAKVGLNTTEFNRGVAELSKKMQIIGQDFKNASGDLDKVGDAAEISRLKITKLTGQIEEQKKVVDQFTQAHKNAVSQFGEGSKQALDYELKLKKAQGTLQSMERQLTTATAELKRQTSAFEILGQKMTDISAKCKDFGTKMKDVGKSLSMSVTAPIVGLGVAAVKMASDLTENVNKVDVAFKKNSGEVKSWSDTTLQSFGISKGSALEMASLFGDMGTAMGQSTSEAASMSTGLVGLAGDLASFKNIGLAQAQDALKGIFTGEGESLKSLGVIMQDSTLKAFALATGQKKSYQEMTQAEKVALRYAFVMDATKNAQGDFARTSDGTANQTRIFGESMKELGANMGQYLLPVVTPLIAKLTEMVQAFGNLDDKSKKIILVVAGIAAVIGPIILVVGSLVSAFGAITGVVGAASTAIAAAGGILTVITGPIGIAVAAIAALVTGGVLLYKNWDTIKAVAIEAWAAIKQAGSDLKGWLVNFFTVSIPQAFTTAIAWFKDLPSKAAQYFDELPGKIGFALGNAMGTLIRWGADAIKWATENVPLIIDKVAEFFSELPGKISSYLGSVLLALRTWVTEMIGSAKIEIPKIITSVVGFFAALPGEITNIGVNIVKGLWNGMNSMGSWLKDKIRDFAKGIVQGMKSALGIKSPSSVMRDQVGAMVGLGMAEGIDGSSGAVGDAMNRLNKQLASSSKINMNASLSGFSAAIRPAAQMAGSGSAANITIINQGTIVGRNGMDEFAAVISKKLARTTGLATGGAY